MTDYIKQLTGKNPAEYVSVAKMLVDNSDVALFEKLVKQDDFLFDFIKQNVANRIYEACNKDNYLNLISFFKYYSPSYESVFAEVLHNFGGDILFETMLVVFKQGSDEERAYTLKYFELVDGDLLYIYLPLIRDCLKSEFEPLAANAAELLSILKDEQSKNNALEKLNADDEFEKYDAVKFLINYHATDCVDKILEVMKQSTFSENIAAQIPYLVPLDNLIEQDFESALLVMCNIINGIPDIISISAICDYNFSELFEKVISKSLTSASAVMLRLAKDKFEDLYTNDEYTYDCDKNTKNELEQIYRILKTLNSKKLESFLYDELFEESPFVFFALDYVDEPEELVTLLDSKNPTLILKVLSVLKDKNCLETCHKEIAAKNIENDGIRRMVEAL